MVLLVNRAVRLWPLFAIFIDRVLTAGVNCYYPDGSPAIDYYWEPCDLPAKSSGSSCCMQNDTCLGNGLCLMSDDTLYRGAATYRSRMGKADPVLCESSTWWPAVILWRRRLTRAIASTSDVAFLRSCSPGRYCCETQDDCCEDDISIFDLGSPQVDQATARLELRDDAKPTDQTSASVATVTVTATPSPSPTETTSSAGGQPVSLTVIIAVSVCCGVVLVLALAVLYVAWQAAKSRRHHDDITTRKELAASLSQLQTACSRASMQHSPVVDEPTPVYHYSNQYWLPAHQTGQERLPRWSAQPAPRGMEMR